MLRRLATLGLVLSLPALAHATEAELYNRHCAFCHGAVGRGNGPAAARLPVPPADFTSANFKLRSTPSGAMPTDDDLLGTISRGVPGAGMPSFAMLPRSDREALVGTVKRLALGAFDSRPSKAVIAVPPRPRPSPALAARGKKLYRDLSCQSCHGEDGRGDGPSAPELKDYAGKPLRATDFTLGIFKGGADPRQLYLRIATGLNGTPMPQYGDDVVSPADRWALVEYLLTLVGT